jgi:hypothetical protein
MDIWTAGLYLLYFRALHVHPGDITISLSHIMVPSSQSVRGSGKFLMHLAKTSLQDNSLGRTDI